MNILHDRVIGGAKIRDINPQFLMKKYRTRDMKVFITISTSCAIQTF